MAFLSKTRSLVMGIGLTIIGIGCMIYGLIMGISARTAPVDLYEVDWNTLKPYQHVEFDLDFIADCYMYYERDGKETSRFYAVPNLYANEDGYVDVNHFMGIAVAQKDFAQYEKLADSSYEWWSDETGSVEFGKDAIHIDGYLRKMSSKDKEYMKKYMTEDWGYSDSEADEMMTKYVIMTNGASGGGILAAGAIVMVMGLGLLAYAIIRIVKGN